MRIPADRHLTPSSVFPDPQTHLRVIRIPDHGTGRRQHSHAFHELVVVLAGHGRHAVGPETYDIAAGDVFVILGETTHGYPETDHLSLINILFDPHQLGIPVADLGNLPGYHALFTVEPHFRRTGKFENRLTLTVEQLETVERLVRRVESELADGERGCRFMATTHLMALIGTLSRFYSALERGDPRSVTQLSEVLGYMHRHYAEPLTVADLKRVAHMSETSLMRAFRQTIGRPPIDYLIRLRISRAQELLHRTEMPVTDIAYTVGFADSNYFARQFRRLTGTSPRAYRTRMRHHA